MRVKIFIFDIGSVRESAVQEHVNEFLNKQQALGKKEPFKVSHINQSQDNNFLTVSIWYED